MSNKPALSLLDIGAMCHEVFAEPDAGVRHTLLMSWKTSTLVRAIGMFDQIEQYELDGVAGYLGVPRRLNADARAMRAMLIAEYDERNPWPPKV